MNFRVSRGSGKTGLEMYNLLEHLKKTAKSEDDRLFYTMFQEEWINFYTNLNLGYWK